MVASCIHYASCPSKVYVNGFISGAPLCTREARKPLKFFQVLIIVRGILRSRSHCAAIDWRSTDENRPRWSCFSQIGPRERLSRTSWLLIFVGNAAGTSRTQEAEAPPEQEKKCTLLPTMQTILVCRFSVQSAEVNTQIDTRGVRMRQRADERHQ